MPFAVLFPGQGSQHVGMGADLFAARPDLLGAASDASLGWSLSDLCLNGPEAELTRTDRAQPALFATAYSLWEAFDAASDGASPAAAALSVQSMPPTTVTIANGNAIGRITILTIVAITISGKPDFT